MGLHTSLGTRGFTQSRNTLVYTVEERHGLHSGGTPWNTQPMNAREYTVDERQGLHSR